MLEDQKKMIQINRIDDGMALIHHAAKSGNLEMVKSVLNFFGVDPHLKNASGKTADKLTQNLSVRKAILNFKSRSSQIVAQKQSSKDI